MLTKNEINMARELTKKIQVQGDLIAKVLCNMTGSEWFECVEFLPSPTGEKGISITVRNDVFGMVRTRVKWFPEEYLSKSEAELVYELNRRREMESRRKEAEERAEKVAKEREKEEAAKKRYQMFLELKKEFEGVEDKQLQKGRQMVDDDRFSVEQVLEIGRRFQQEDRWYGAHYDTVKLLCDTIEKLYAEVQKCQNIHLQDEEYNEVGN